MAAFLLGCGAPKLHCVSLPLKQYLGSSQSHHFSMLRSVVLRQPQNIITCPFLHVTQSTKTRCCRYSTMACSSKSPSDDDWKRAVDAMDSRGRRVTIGDVVSDNQDPAQKALQALFVADTNGSFKVSGEGVVVYVFPKDYGLKLAVKLVRRKIESLLEKGKMSAEYLVVVSFGISLAASCIASLPAALIYAVLKLCCQSLNFDDASFHYSSQWNLHSLTSLELGLIVGPSFRFLGNDDRRGFDRIRNSFSLSGGLRIIDYVWYIIFGDGDPNQGIEEKRWKMIGHYIALNGGVVTAEELAPYLDPVVTEKMDYDSYMLPVLLRFGGQPKVDEEGNIVYQFPSVYCTPPAQRSRGKEYVGRWADWDIKVEKYLKEKQWKFIKGDAEEIAHVKFALRYNLFAAAILLCTFWESPFLCYLYLTYVIYAVSVELIQSIRPSSIQERNAKIVERNGVREWCAMVLELPDISLKRKLLSAREIGRRTCIDSDRIAYSGERGCAEQSDCERGAWDRILKERWG